jgi:alpha-tubulin suppressor-like RCC1 family protein
MKKAPFLIAIVSLVLSCVNNHGTNDETISGVKVMIYEPDGKTPASGATVKIFKVSETEGRFVSKQTTDAEGRYTIAEIPAGEYNVWAEKESNVTFQDSIVISKTQTTLQSDTLTCPSTLTGIVGVQPQHDPQSVTIQVVGTDKFFNNTDENGVFTMTGMAGGTYSLLLKSTLPDYTPTTQSVTVQNCSDDTLKNTVVLKYTGIPVVRGLQVSQDTLAGVVRFSWDRTKYKNIQDYVLYRDSCSALNLSTKHFAATIDTLYRDTVYRSSTILPDDTLPLCLKYRVAIRNNVQEIGPTYRYAQITVAPKSYVTTFFDHKVRHAELGCDSASINDTVILSVAAWNRTRPLRTIAWFDPKKKDTIATRSSSDSLAIELSDTIRLSFDSVGINRLLAIVTDDAGKKWTDTVPVKIVRDAPVANAGNDTGVWINDTVRLHGSAMQRFGAIVKWEWKFGSGSWNRTSGPDTVIVPSTVQAIICSLAVTDDDGNRAVDEMKLVFGTQVKSIAAGGLSSLILKTDATLWACGNNGEGQLGDGTTIERHSPVQIMSDAQGMAMGSSNFILKTDGTLWACGWNESGQLGDGTTTDRHTPVRVMSDVQNIATYSFHSLILKTDATLWACGYNYSGQLGDGTTIERHYPVLAMNDVQRMEVGSNYSLILKTGGTLWACGNNGEGEFGDGTTISRATPIQVMSDVQSMAAGYLHSLILKTDGTLWACGDNREGQLGDGTTIERHTPVQIMSDVQSTVAGGAHSLILKTDGTLWACGRNDQGQLGDGTTIDRHTPVQIMSDVQSMAAGDDHSLILKTDGTLWACGGNGFGQLGDGTTTTRTTPVRIIPPQQ